MSVITTSCVMIWKGIKAQITILSLFFTVCLVAGTLVFTLAPPDNEANIIYIRLIDITWPPPPELIIQSETYVSYDVPMVFELWNPSKTTYTYTTGNSNLLNPQMKIVLADNYSFVTGYIFWIFITTQTIPPGVTVREAAITVSINVYNDTIPPVGDYTVWAGIVGAPESYGHPPFTYKSYKTVIYQTSNDSTIEYSSVPKNWGKTFLRYWEYLPALFWSLSGVELLIVVYILVRNYLKESR